MIKRNCTLFTSIGKSSRSVAAEIRTWAWGFAGLAGSHLQAKVASFVVFWPFYLLFRQSYWLKFSIFALWLVQWVAWSIWPVWPICLGNEVSDWLIHRFSGHIVGRCSLSVSLSWLVKGLSFIQVLKTTSSNIFERATYAFGTNWGLLQRNNYCDLMRRFSCLWRGVWRGAFNRNRQCIEVLE